MGHRYETARTAQVVGYGGKVPVLSRSGSPFSGFHQGAGETTMFEFLDRHHRTVVVCSSRGDYVEGIDLIYECLLRVEECDTEIGSYSLGFGAIRVIKPYDFKPLYLFQ